MATDTCRAVVAAATFSRKQVNQDSFEVLDGLGARGAIVADGLGSHFGAEVAAAVATSTIAQSLRAMTEPKGADFAAALRDARQVLRARTDALTAGIHGAVDPRNSFGTTVICGLDLPDRLLVGYVGNGGAFHVRGNFNQFPSSQLLPWSALNHLNPHSKPEAGKNALYKFLAPGATDAQIAPSVVEISKDDDGFGDLLILCTDGVYSWDQTPIGRDDDRKVWISGEASVSLLFDALGSFFASGPHDADGLQAHLVAYLAALDRENLVSDDCTLAVIVSPQAIHYQQQSAAAAPSGGR